MLAKRYNVCEKSSGELLYNIAPVANRTIHLHFDKKVDLIVSVLTTKRQR